MVVVVVLWRPEFSCRAAVRGYVPTLPYPQGDSHVMILLR